MALPLSACYVPANCGIALNNLLACMEEFPILLQPMQNSWSVSSVALKHHLSPSAHLAAIALQYLLVYSAFEYQCSINIEQTPWWENVITETRVCGCTCPHCTCFALTQWLGDKTSKIKLCHWRRNWNTWWPSLNWLFPVQAHSAVIPSTGSITGSEMLISFPLPVLHLGWKRLCQLVLQEALVWVPHSAASWKHQSAGKWFYSDLVQKDHG